MISEGHLKVYDFILTTRAPLFIGQGTSYTKKDYCYDSRTQRVSILDQHRFFEKIAERGLVDLYERFVLGRDADLNSFLTNECGFSAADIRDITRYTVSAALALDDRHSLKEIHAFQRDAYGRAYIPGSSVKGTLRTVILTDMIRNAPPSDPNLKIADIEAQCLHTLHLKRPELDAVNSLMRGIAISDSEPVSDRNMILCAKWDGALNGRVHRINLCRECIKPNTQMRFKLTLDTSVLKDNLTVETLISYIDRYGEYYWDTYAGKFMEPDYYSGEGYYNSLILGGGAGFFSKTVAYPAYGKNAVSRVKNSFKNHKHEQDTVISPPTMKYAEYDGKMYPYGVCEVKIY